VGKGLCLIFEMIQISNVQTSFLSASQDQLWSHCRQVLGVVEISCVPTPRVVAFVLRRILSRVYK
jgi:hypothetical protein